MRVAVVTPGFSRSEREWAIPALEALLCRLAAEHSATVFSLRYPAAGRYAFCGLTHQALGGGQRMGVASLGLVARAVRAIVAAHRRTPFDLLHAFWVDEPGLVAFIAGRLIRRPVIATLGGGELVHLPAAGYGTYGSRWRRAGIRLVLRSATRVTAGSAYGRRLCMHEGAPPEHTHLAPLGVDVARFQPAPPPAGHPIIVQAASLTPVKNQALLLDIVARVREACPTCCLLLAGDGPVRKELEARAAALGIAEAVKWAGRVPHGNMPAFYARGHLYLQTSHHESQGMALLEAMACGLPALGTPVGVAPEVAVAPAMNEPDTLAAQVVALLSDAPAYRAARKVAVATVAARFTLAEATARFTALYREVSASSIARSSA
ncbi:MAG: glycosyltransferase [Candidatus Promineifilaceae bacterium]|nr:glycosyltransferase [Candidatus Promineifilaceae bacterium]